MFLGNTDETISPWESQTSLFQIYIIIIYRSNVMVDLIFICFSKILF